MPVSRRTTRLPDADGSEAIRVNKHVQGSSALGALLHGRRGGGHPLLAHQQLLFKAK